MAQNKYSDIYSKFKSVMNECLESCFIEFVKPSADKLEEAYATKSNPDNIVFYNTTLGSNTNLCLQECD